MFNLNPKEDTFFDLFITSAEISYKAAIRLQSFLDELEDSDNKLKEIKEIEHEGDKQQHQIFKQLNKSFITPFDREDIYSIGKDMDDITDLIESTASRFVMLNVKNSTDEAKLMSKMIVNSCRETITLMKELKDMKTSKKLVPTIIEINRIEEEGDKVSRKAIKELFIKELPVIEIIKWREIYQYFEDTLDACEDLANVVEGVMMKNA